MCPLKDELELRYKLNSNRDAEVLRSRVASLADGRLHTVAVRRESDSVSVQVIALQSGTVGSTVAVETFSPGRHGLTPHSSLAAVKSLSGGSVSEINLETLVKVSEQIFQSC